jgi:hypothetical protein
MVQGVEDTRIHKLLRRLGVAQEGSEASSMETLEAAHYTRGAERELNFSFRSRAAEEDLRPWED